MTKITRIAITATMATLLIVGKWALSAVANVEVVTLFIAVFSLSFGWISIVATVVFVMVDSFIWGLAPWVISYFIYWPLLAAIFTLVGKFARKTNQYKLPFALAVTTIGVVMTAFFGVLTTAIDTTIGITGNTVIVAFNDWGKRFAIMYLRGIPFFLTHIASSAVTLSTLSLPLTKLLNKTRLQLTLNEK